MRRTPRRRRKEWQPQKGTGAALVAAIQASPYREIEIVLKGYVLPVREVDLDGEAEPNGLKPT
jgi:hypothetical protein